MLEVSYRVADHTFSVFFLDGSSSEDLLPSFAPFKTENPSDVLFRLYVDDTFCWEEYGREIGQFDCGGCNHGVYRCSNGDYQFVVSGVEREVCCHMQSNSTFTENRVALKTAKQSQRAYGLNNAIMMAFAFSSATASTLLMHASVIRCDGKGYLMTAPSGTGKSTHTRLWYDNIPGCDLMNDDNPVVRIVDGEPFVYGSPWSGKTRCYRNIQAPVGALVQIKQRSENTIRRLGTLEAFAALLPAMSTMKWDQRVYKGVCDSISALILRCGVWTLGCRPDAEAAFVCHAAVASQTTNF